MIGRSMERSVRGGGVLGLALVLGLAACAGPRPAAREEATGPAREMGPAYLSLAREARREGASAAWEGPLPPGLPEELTVPLSPGSAEHARAAAPLDLILKELTGEPALPRAVIEPSTERDRDAALRRYVTGRQKLLAGDVAGAAGDLRAATRLDPGAPEPWRELAEAQNAMGARADAVASLGAAVARGLREPRALEILGRAAQERSDFTGAARLFAHAWQADPAGTDPGLPAIVLVGLGRTLLELERLEGAREALELALEFLGRVGGPTRYPQEIGFIVRRQADLWTEIGDAQCRLARYDGAIRAYLQAAALPALDGVDLSSRVVYAAVRAGRPAAAAVHVLDRIAEADGAVTPRDVDVLRALGRDAAVRRHAAAALKALRLSRPEGTPVSILGGLSRAEAAVRAPEQARETLLTHLRRYPEDIEVAEALFRVSPSAGRDAARLTTEHPALADRFAESLLRARPRLEALVAELEGAREGPGAKLVGGLTLARAGQLDRAGAMLATLSEGGSAGVAATVARIRVAAARGHWTEAEEQLSRLDAGSGPDTRRARAQGLRALQRFAEALATLRPVLAEASIDDLLSAAELGLTPESVPATAEEIEGWIRRALQADPRSDRAYALLLSLHAPGGPAPDEARTSQTLRELRQSHPESRLLTILRGQEFVRRSFLAQAERELLGLAKDDPMDRDVIEILVSIWERPGTPGGVDRPEGERWLREQVEQRPWASHLTGGLARVLIGSDRGDEAEALLRGSLEKRPDAYLSRILEELLRGTPGRAEEADHRALARLEPLPRPIDASLELAEVYARLDRESNAVEAVRGGVPAGAELTVDQRRRLLLVAGSIAVRATQAPDSRGRAEAVWLLDELVRRRIDFAAELHERRLVLLATTPEADADRLADAAEWTAKRLPSLGAAPYLRMAEALVSAGRANVALQVIARAASESASVDVLMEWVRLSALAGSAEDVRAVVSRAEETGQLGPLVERLLADGPRDESTMRDPRGVLAYAIGAFCMSAGREPEAEAIYELALEYDPGHPWANNNLGYALADRGDRLDRAEELLERAHAALPEDASVLDSLGWLRYRQGVLEDEVDGELVKRLGALTLLERATRTPEGAINPTIMDHYGDTLWALGRLEEARRAWAAAERAAVSRMRSLRNADESSTIRRELRELARSTRSKLDAARLEREPPVTPPGERPARMPAGGPGERANGGN